MPLTWYLSTSSSQVFLAPQIRGIVREIDPLLPVFGMNMVTTVRDESIQLESTVATLSLGFSIVATILAAIGLYGLLSYQVVTRTQEFGIRMALGASQGSVLKMILREATTYLGFGLIIGVPVALGFGKLLESQLFELGSADTAALLSATMVVIVTVVLASLIPAKRAATIEPLEALRYE